MLIISPVQTKEEQEKICSALGVDFKKELFCYAGMEDGEPLTACQFRIHGTEGEFFDITLRPGIGDDEALLLTGRAVFNFLDHCRIRYVTFIRGEGFDERIARLIGFRPDENGVFRADLNLYFHNPHKHEHENG